MTTVNISLPPPPRGFTYSEFCLPKMGDWVCQFSTDGVRAIKQQDSDKITDFKWILTPVKMKFLVEIDENDFRELGTIDQSSIQNEHLVKALNSVKAGKEVQEVQPPKASVQTVINACQCVRTCGDPVNGVVSCKDQPCNHGISQPTSCKTHSKPIKKNEDICNRCNHRFDLGKHENHPSHGCENCVFCVTDRIKLR